MEQWKLLFFVLLPLSLCIDTEEVVVKTTREKQDVIPVCTPASLHLITLIVCEVSTKSSQTRECRLLYGPQQKFESECDSRFTLRTDSHSVFLHLTELTPKDSGNYSCECSHLHGTDFLHLSITVEGDEDLSTSPVRMLTATIAICTSTAFIIITGVVLGLVIKKKHCSHLRQPGSCRLSICENPCSLGRDDPDDSYMSLQQPDSDVYQNMMPKHHQHGASQEKTRAAAAGTVHLEQEVNKCQKFEIYESI